MDKTDDNLIPEFMEHRRTYNDVRIYETSWDALMPVVEKIFTILVKQSVYRDQIEMIESALLTIDIKMVHGAVLEFIKFHNQQQSKQ